MMALGAVHECLKRWYKIATFMITLYFDKTDWFVKKSIYNGWYIVQNHETWTLISKKKKTIKSINKNKNVKWSCKTNVALFNLSIVKSYKQRLVCYAIKNHDQQIVIPWVLSVVLNILIINKWGIEQPIH